MKTNKIQIVLGLLLLLGLMVSACAKLNPKFEGSLDNALDAKKSEFQTCYEALLEKNRDAKGEIDLQLEFAPKETQPKKVSITKTQLQNGEMKSCVTTAAKGIETTELPGTWVNGKYTLDFTYNE